MRSRRRSPPGAISDKAVRRRDLLKGDPETMPEADLASIQKSWSELMKRRLKLMAGMDPPQRQQTVDRFRPVMQINSALTTWRLKGMRDKLKAVQPPGVPESPPAVPDPGTAPVPAEPGTPPQGDFVIRPVPPCR